MPSTMFALSVPLLASVAGLLLLLPASVDAIADDGDAPARRGAPPADNSVPPPIVIDGDDSPPPPPPKFGEPIRFWQVQVHDGFWRDVLDRNRDLTLPAVWLQTERSGRFANFEAARTVGNRRGQAHRGRVYDDSDVYKLLEGASWIFAESQDPRLLERIDGGSRRVVGAQRPDGYINTWHTLQAPERRFSDMPHGHELYCIGHLLEAAAARYEIDGDRVLLDAGRRAADLVEREFGPNGRPDVCGHPQIELGLVRLYEVLGEERHLELAEWFLQQRGRAEGRPSAGEYAQDHVPLAEQTEVVGHAVRAMYLYAAAADVARIREDDTMVATLERLWDDLVERKMYVTGGIGSSAHNEGFTAAYDLPNDGAYAETCAAIGLAMWAHRMNMLTFDAKYVDVMERALYNAILAGVSLGGDAFFYANPLASHGGSRRSAWFDCACCPSNLLRHLASMRDRLLVRTQGTRSGNTLYVNHYLSGEATMSFGRNTVRVLQRTDYPWDGRVQIWLSGGLTRTYRLALRIPSWAESFTILRDGEEVEATVEKGYAILDGPWTANQSLELRLPMPVRTLESPSQVAGNHGRFALARGPIVYCVEEVDSAPDLRRLSFDDAQEFRTVHRDGEEDPLRGMMSINGSATRTRGDGTTEMVDFTAVPYFAWANRDPGAMLVWLPTRRELADPEPVGGIVPSASFVSDRDPLVALHDGIAPDPNEPSSWRRPMPRFTWWPRRGTWEWVAYDFDAPRTVAAIELHWFDDLELGGEVTTPRTVRLLRRENEEWVQVAELQFDGTERQHPHGQLTRLSFEPVRTESLRLDVHLQEGRSAGLLEWRVIDAVP